MKKQEYLNYIKHFMDREPKLSCEITEKLVNKFNVTTINARKIIFNLLKEGKLYRFEDIIFDSGSMLIYKTNNQKKFLEAARKRKDYINYILRELDNLNPLFKHYNIQF